MASNFKTEHADAVTYSLMVIQAAAQQLALLDVKFPVVLDALVEAYACTMAFDRLETSHALDQSSLDFALAHQINAAVRLQDLNIPEPEIRLLREYQQSASEFTAWNRHSASSRETVCRRIVQVSSRTSDHQHSAVF